MAYSQISREEKIMAINMHVVVTSGVGSVTVDEETAKELESAYNTLKELPVNRALSTDPFPTAADARLFVKQGRAWAESQTGPNDRQLVFARKGDIKGAPLVVTFRIYERRGDGTEDE
jgi:hypothetical protein